MGLRLIKWNYRISDWPSTTQPRPEMDKQIPIPTASRSCFLSSFLPFTRFCWSGLAQMASSYRVAPLARRPIIESILSGRATSRAHSHFSPARRRCLLMKSKPNCLPSNTRNFSATLWRRLADVDDTFNPGQQDRESDQVDVCVIGGGKHSSHLHQATILIFIHRTRRSQCGNSSQTIGQ